MFEHVVIHGYILYAAIGSLVFLGLTLRGDRQTGRPATGNRVPDVRDRRPALPKAA